MKKTRTNEEALNTFVALNGKIEALLDELRDINCEHYGLDPDEIHWGHVGDVRRTLDALQDVLDRIKGEGEYAR